MENNIIWYAIAFSHIVSLWACVHFILKVFKDKNAGKPLFFILLAFLLSLQALPFLIIFT